MHNYMIVFNQEGCRNIPIFYKTKKEAKEAFNLSFVVSGFITLVQGNFRDGIAYGKTYNIQSLEFIDCIPQLRGGA